MAKELDLWVIIAGTGGKCNKPPRNATAEARRRRRNLMAQRRRVIKNMAIEAGYDNIKHYLAYRQRNFIYGYKRQ